MVRLTVPVVVCVATIGALLTSLPVTLSVDLTGLSQSHTQVASASGVLKVEATAARRDAKQDQQIASDLYRDYVDLGHEMYRIKQQMKTAKPQRQQALARQLELLASRRAKLMESHEFYSKRGVQKDKHADNLEQSPL
eukprot:GFYU01011628.1.p1 GENE.GFYU01011628.1~~GFYU01011628.1.p1  ORF type:complete len:138 (-),score=11.44 GFYU01011628.1:325-738(-)